MHPENPALEKPYKYCRRPSYERGIPNKCIHDIRRTVSAKLKLSLPTASVSAILGHTEETNEQFYNPDILSDMVKAEALSGIWNDSVNVLPTVTLENEVDFKTKNKQETAKIVPFPA